MAANLTLCVDTTGEDLVLALADGHSILWRLDEHHDSMRYHSSILLPRIQEALTALGATPEQLQAIALNCGPGSFTGIRTGLTMARLMGQFMPLALYGFNTFELLAASPAFRGSTTAVYRSAFRQQPYSAGLQVDDGGRVTWLHSPEVWNNADFSMPKADRVVMQGSLKKLLAGAVPDSVIVLEESGVFVPEAMLFYIAQNPEPFCRTWQTLLPYYLQLPNITAPKSKASSAPSPNG